MEEVDALVPNRNAELLAAGPRRLAAELRPRARRIAAAIALEVRRGVPAWARALTGRSGEIFTEAVEQAVLHVIDSIGDPDVARRDWIELLRTQGRLEFAESHDSGSLHAAARIGARVAWQHVAPVIRDTGASPQVLAHAAEIIFAYVEQLSAAAVENESLPLASGTIERRRKQLLELLLTGSPVPEAVAHGAGWTLPGAAAVVALESTGDNAAFPVELLDDEVLVDLESSRPCLLTAQPGAALVPLAGRWQGWRAAVSPTVPLPYLPSAHQLARRALAALGTDGPEPVIWCAHRLAELWLLDGDLLAAELRRRALGPLAELAGHQRERLAETLLVWLESRGGAPEVARRLGVHPQTVRARLHQLRGLFGDRLDDPDERFGLRLALRSERLESRPS
ncbi:PucR family transcriptional regulator [Amycolatopsis sp. K13G38]|uniref:PucR family transcriptional regulator n=2 Tax=Amycolatopsis acididurans TaxID=2724524 RepID=A0ABX1JHL0_9PSEU|nr:PucR family transcriptional regulator [Amycolatopsis acididurans]